MSETTDLAIESLNSSFDSLKESMKDSDFEGNAATTYGGAIYAIDGGQAWSAEGSSFTSNTAKAGGAICSFAPLTVEDSEFASNAATNGDGGAIYSGNMLNITSTVFEASTASTGGAIYSAAAITIQQSEFVDNVSQGSGGAIRHTKTAAVNIQNTDFVGNRNKGTVLTDANYPENNGGGAIMLQGSPSAVVITGGKFENNYSASNGGAIQLNSVGSNGLTITDVAFIGNEAVVNGGAAHTKAAAKLNNCTFSGNTAASGAAIHRTSGTTTATGCTFAEGQSCYNVTIQ